MLLWGQRTRSTRGSHAPPGSLGKPGTGGRGLDIPGITNPERVAICYRYREGKENAKMRYAAGIGPPDVVTATCPLRGALGGNPLSRGSMDAVLRLHGSPSCSPVRWSSWISRA